MPLTPFPSQSSLVLLPGLEGTGTTFNSFVAQRPAHQDVQVIGYPSDRPAGYDELLDLVWDQLPTDRPYFLLGESFSGPLAVRVAARKPRALQGVILCASFVWSPTPWYLRWWPGLFTTSVVKTLIQLESAAMRTLVGIRRRPECAPPAADSPSVCPHVIAARVRATMTVDVTRELKDVQVPLMYLAASWDMVIPRRSQHLIRRIRPDVEFRTINGPHALLQTRPAEAWNVLNAWCEQRRLGESGETCTTSAADITPRGCVLRSA